VRKFKAPRRVTLLTQTMNASLKASLIRSTAVALFAGASLFLSACSTTPTSTASLDKTQQESNEKPVTYAELHNMMTTLVNQPELGSAASLTGTLPIASVNIDASHTLASNP
jgi:hypothetical protein